MSASPPKPSTDDYGYNQQTGKYNPERWVSRVVAPSTCKITAALRVTGGVARSGYGVSLGTALAALALTIGATAAADSLKLITTAVEAGGARQLVGLSSKGSSPTGIAARNPAFGWIVKLPSYAGLAGRKRVLIVI